MKFAIRYFVSTLVLAFEINTGLAQSKNDFATTSVALEWQIKQNNYKKKPASLSTLTIKTAGMALPPQGWKMYFNFARKITASLQKKIDIKHVNGDLFYLSPKPGFKGLTPNATLDVDFVSADWLINYTDAPEGFFMVFDDTPQKTYPINLTVLPLASKVQFKRLPTDKVGFTTAGQIYEQNKLIRNVHADSLIRIFPTPYDYKITPYKFNLTANVLVKANVQFVAELGMLKDTLQKRLGVKTQDNAKNTIALSYDPDVERQGYKLDITGTDVTISASTTTGMYYGVQSFLMLLPVEATNGTVVLQGMQVSDKPRFAYRAVMLDVSRNFQPKQQVKKLISLMALYKLNKLHFHLTDDEGWRLEIRELPELTAIGAKRGYSVSGDYLEPALGSGADVNNKTGTGFYTRADFIEILKYAKLHHIEVIPEIESPGHARAAVKAMFKRYTRLMAENKPVEAAQYLLNDIDDTSKYSSVQMYNDNVMNVALPSAYTFMQTVTDAIIDMYREADAPLSTIHFGGDEVPAGVWEGSPAVKKLIAQNIGVKNADDLWSYFYGRLDNMLKQRNLYLTAWEEVGLKKELKGKAKVNVLNNNMTGKNVHLEVWNNIIGWGAEDLAYNLANNNYKVILSCVTNLYFDMAYEKNYNEPGYYWGGYTDVDEGFKFIPFDYLKNVYTDRFGNPINRKYVNKKEKLTTESEQNIIGIQGALWAETVKSAGRMEYMILPKLLGLSERSWAKHPDWAIETDSAKSAQLYNIAYSKFINVISKYELPRLDAYAGGYHYRIPQPGAIVKNGVVEANIKYNDLTIRYTVDGTEPDEKSTIYTQPIANKGTIKLRAFNRQGRGGQSVELKN